MQQRRDQSLLPSFNSIVECERKLLFFFGWDLKFVLPLHIVRAFLANGVLFSNEFTEIESQFGQAGLDDEIGRLKAEWSRNITTESIKITQTSVKSPPRLNSYPIIIVPKKVAAIVANVEPHEQYEWAADEWVAP